MPLNDDALVSLEEARTYLDVTSAQKPSDAWLTAVVNGISREVHSYTGRLYQPSSSLEARVFEYDGGKVAEVDDCREPDRVRISPTPKDAASWIDVAANDWVAEPFREPVKRAIVFLRDMDPAAWYSGWDALALHARQDPGTEWPRQARAAIDARTYLEVRAKWGHAEVPANVKLAVEMWLQNIQKRDIAYFSPRLDEGAAPLPGPMPKDVQSILDDERADFGASVVAV